MEKYGIVIVAYKPNIYKLNLKIKEYSKNINSTLVIVNNGGKIKEIKKENIKYINLDQNRGIAYAQNKGVSYLTKKGIKYVFLFDQDSNVSECYFKEMLIEWHKIKRKDNLIGVLAPNIYDVKSKKVLDTRQIYNNKLKKYILKNNYIYNALPISSGILIDVEVFKKVGGNKSEYFIDWVDFQFDLDVIRAGYHIYKTANVQINHQIGNATKCKFLWKTIHPTNHSAFRNYYFFRNGILFMHKNKDFLFVKKFVIKSLLKRYIFVFYEKECLKKHRAQICGIKDALKLIK